MPTQSRWASQSIARIETKLGVRRWVARLILNFLLLFMLLSGNMCVGAGDESVVSTVSPLFELMGKNIKHMGPAGSGQHTKMVNQILIASTMIGVVEGMLYAKK